MISIQMVIAILFNHWFADFVLQSNKMAIGKSSSFSALCEHTCVYTCAWIPFCLFAGNSHFAWIFLLTTLVAHTMTDFFTSRLNAYLWKKEKRWEFFVSVGFDQWLHYVQLLLTYYLLTK